MTSEQLSTYAAEFLHINRYLDFQQEFYDELLIYCGEIKRVNFCLEKWLENAEWAEKWLKNYKNGFLRSLNILKKYFQVT